MIGSDLTPFFVPGEFVLEGDTLNGAPVAGIFDAAYAVTGEGMGMADTHPVYTMASVAVPAQPVGLVLVCAGARYEVVDAQPDGTGVTLLILECL